MRLLFLLLFISPFSFAGYTTMTLEGVKEANGIWTAAGVVDNMGFVRTTGSVTVSGATSSTAVSLAVDKKLASATFKGILGKLGPVAMTAVGAYDVYSWLTSDGLVPCDDNGTAWCHAPDLTGYDDSYKYGQSYKACSGTCYFGSTRTEACTKAVTVNPTYKLTSITDTKCNVAFSSNGSPAGYFGLTAVSCTIVGNVSLSCTQQKDPSKPSPTPLESGYYNSKDIPANVLADGFNKFPDLKGNVPISSTSFTPFSVWLGDPYFKDGNWYRDRVDISPAPTKSQPSRVRTDIGPVKLDGQTDPNVVPDTGNGGGAATPKEKPSFCEANPGSIACQEMGELKQEPFEPVEKPFNITPQNPWGSGDAQCPAPKVMHLTTGSTVTLSYQPACDFFRGVRPAVLALALLAALYIALGIPVGKGD